MRTIIKEILINDIVWKLEFTYGYRESKNCNSYSLHISRPEDSFPATIMLYTPYYNSHVSRVLCIENSAVYTYSLLECKRKILEYLLYGNT